MAIANRYEIPKWILSQNKQIYYHEDPFAEKNDYGLLLKNVYFAELYHRNEDPALSTGSEGTARILFDTNNSEIWFTDKDGQPTFRAKYGDDVLRCGGNISVRRSKLLKQDGFLSYTIADKVASPIWEEYGDKADNFGESWIEITLT